MRNSSHAGFWLAMCMVLFLLTPLFRSGVEMREFAAEEIRITHDALGERLGGSITENAASLFSNSPLVAFVKGMNTARESESRGRKAAQVMGAGAQMISGSFQNYTSGLIYEAYIVSMRAMVVLAWLFVLLPFLAVAAYDGFNQRAIKLEEFGKLRPATYTVAGIVVIPMLFAPLIYLVLPFSISPMVAPVWAALVAIPLSVLLSNTQPLFGK